ncbi:hypothetical protein B296_00029841 [Ensete ventricosum]|uniref:Reverse transcriptase domain-containing protein n=1 Tax=Ensete ventricosum TaxID=4639 RepID=A0A426YWT2_ENSVE|nr:hypothetical protein B296_00029841 [Ensete ventricosum]
MRTRFEERDHECYYHFHRDYDHDTKECYDLKNQIEDLIRQDHLDRYVRKPRESSLYPKGPVERQIDIIVGGVATLPVTFGDEPRTKTLMVPFMVVELPPTYNVIIGRSTLNKLRTVVLTYHRIIKFLTSTGAAKSTCRCSLIPSWWLAKSTEVLRLESLTYLAFGTEVVLPLEVVYPTLRIEHFTPRASKVGLRENLNFAEEHRAKAHLRILHYQRAIARLYN